MDELGVSIRMIVTNHFCYNYFQTLRYRFDSCLPLLKSDVVSPVGYNKDEAKSLVVLSQVISRFVFIAFIDFRPQETKPDPKLIK